MIADHDEAIADIADNDSRYHPGMPSLQKALTSPRGRMKDIENSWIENAWK
jgi:hypothetical protein